MDVAAQAAWIGAAIAENDQDHEQVRTRLSALVAAVRNKGSSQEIAGHLKSLRKIVLHHNQVEEQFMNSIPHYDSSAHRDAHSRHNSYISETMEILDTLSAEEVRCRVAVIDMWFSEHIRTMDADLLQALPRRR